MAATAMVVGSSQSHTGHSNIWPSAPRSEDRSLQITATSTNAGDPTEWVTANRNCKCRDVLECDKKASLVVESTPPSDIPAEDLDIESSYYP
jgi:hypothetical protein